MLGDLIRCAPLLRFLREAGLDRSPVLEVRRDARGAAGAWDGPCLGLGPVLGRRRGASETPLLADPERMPLADAQVAAAFWAECDADLDGPRLEAVLAEMLRVSAAWVAVALPAGLLERAEWFARGDGRYECERRAWTGPLAAFVAECLERSPEVAAECARPAGPQAEAWERAAATGVESGDAPQATLLVLRRREPRQPGLATLQASAGAGSAQLARALAPALRCPACGAPELEATGNPGAPLRCAACGAAAGAGPRGTLDLRACAWAEAGRAGRATRVAAPTVSVIIPAYGRPGLSRRCVESLFSVPAGADFEVIVVDNASPGDLAAELGALAGRVRLVRNELNVGFARACNQGAALAAGRHLLFLNNDTEARPGWLGPLVEALEADAGVGLAGSRLLFADGTVQHAGVALVPDRRRPHGVAAELVYRGEPGDAPQVLRRREFQAVTAACCLVRRPLFEALGGFDAAYWNGLEDVDLCLRAREHGHRVVYEPRSVLTHHESLGGPERYSRMEHNLDLLNSRWAGRVRPDLLDIHLSDGLLPRPAVGPAGSAPGVRPVGETTVLVPAHLGASSLEECLSHIRNHTSLPHQVIVAWDDGMFGSFPKKLLGADLLVVPADFSRGLPRTVNACLRRSQGAQLALIDPRARVEAGWLEGLLAALADGAGAGLAGPLLDVPSAGQQLPAALAALEPARAAAQLRRQRRMEVRPAARLRPECVVFGARVVERIGELDEGLENRLSLADYCLRAREAGLPPVVAVDTAVRLDPPPACEDSPAAERAFEAKWGVGSAECFVLGHPPLRPAPDFPEAGDPAVRELLGSAAGLLSEGRAAEALERVERAEGRSPGLAEAALMRGIARCAGWDFEGAAADFREAARRAPGSRRALAHLAHVLRHLGRLEEAAAAFGRLLELDPQDPEALLDTGDCMVALGRLETARECFRLASRLAPDDAAARERLRLLDGPKDDHEELSLAG